MLLHSVGVWRDAHKAECVLPYTPHNYAQKCARRGWGYRCMAGDRLHPEQDCTEVAEQQALAFCCSFRRLDTIDSCFQSRLRFFARVAQDGLDWGLHRRIVLRDVDFFSVTSAGPIKQVVTSLRDCSRLNWCEIASA